MATNDAKVLGYAGFAIIDGVQVLITSGTITDDDEISYLNPLSIPPTNETRTRAQHADGTTLPTASISFDLTDNFLAILTTGQFVQRGYRFDVRIFDGESGRELTDCLMTSMSLSGSAGGIISCSLSVVSPTSSEVNSTGGSFIRDQEPLGYWFSGNADVKDWTWNINQDTEAVHLNFDQIIPKYIKYKYWDMSLEVTTYEDFQQYDNIEIKTKTFTLTGNTKSQSYNFNGQTDLGTYSHSFESSASMSVGNNETFITIT